MSRVIEWIYDKQWAITPGMLETIIRVASREVEPEAILSRPGEQVRESEGTVIRDGVAVIPVTGPIFPRANLFTRVSGGTSVDMLAEDFAAMLDDPSIKGIVLNVDSPGGEVTSVAEFSEMVFRARGTKPVTAYIYGQGSSAAYWIASAAQEVVIDATARAGSIGVVSAYRDQSKREEKDGVRTIEIVSSVSPNKRANPATDEGRALIQGMVDDIADVFVGTVARNRAVDRDTVIGDFGGGGIMVGARAVAAGLADRLGSLEGIITDMAAATNNSGRNFMNGQTKQTATTSSDHSHDHGCGTESAVLTAAPLTADRVKTESPEVYNEILAAGAVAERERIKAIEDISIPGAEDLIATHKFDPAITEAKMSTLILKEMREHPEKMHAAALRQDGRDLAGATLGAGTNASGMTAKADEEKAAAAKIAEGANQQRR